MFGKNYDDIKDTLTIGICKYKKIWYTENRINKMSVPDDLYVYELKKSNDAKHPFASIAKNVYVGFAGTVFCKESLMKDNEKSVQFDYNDESNRIDVYPGLRENNRPDIYSSSFFDMLLEPDTKFVIEFTDEDTGEVMQHNLNLEEWASLHPYISDSGEEEHGTIIYSDGNDEDEEISAEVTEEVEEESETDVVNTEDSEE